MSEQRKGGYPALDPKQTAAINDALVDVVRLRHAEGLTAAQLAELRASMAVQTENAEALHRFRLTNADEPAFIQVPARTPGA